MLTIVFNCRNKFILIFVPAQNPTITVGDDQSNWAEMLKTMNKSKSDGRSDLAIDVFERILRANAIARGKRYGGSKTLSDYCMSDWRNSV